MSARPTERQRDQGQQKAPAPSQAGHPSRMVDPVTQKKVIDASAELGEQDPALLSLNCNAHRSPRKSAAKLAAERRRHRILSKSNERMAKVQGDRMTGGGAGGRPAQGGAGESLDEMLDAAEAEFFGQPSSDEGAAPFDVKPAESKATPAIQGQTYFKSSPVIPTYNSVGTHTNTQSKATEESIGASKPSLSAADLRKTSRGPKGASGRRRTGNKGMEKQSFDMAAVQSLAQSAKLGKGKMASKSVHKGFLRNVGFWVGLEATTNALLLLLVGAGVGGLLLPEGRAAVAQADFAAAHKRGSGDTKWRSTLESFLATEAGQFDSKGSVNYIAGVTPGEGVGDTNDVDEFGRTYYESSTVGTETEAISVDGEGKLWHDAIGHGEGRRIIEEKGDAEMKTGAGRIKGVAADDTLSAGVVIDGLGEEDTVDGSWMGCDTAGSSAHAVIDTFLQMTDNVLKSIHVWSSAVMPLGLGGRIPCVPAIALALIVRLIVYVFFLSLRILLGLPIFPPAAGKEKYGMIMEMVLATVPMLGKVIVVGTTIKSILSDTTLVVTGTILTLTMGLGGEENSAPRRLAGSLVGVFGGSLLEGRWSDMNEL